MTQLNRSTKEVSKNDFVLINIILLITKVNVKLLQMLTRNSHSSQLEWLAYVLLTIKFTRLEGCHLLCARSSPKGSVWGFFKDT